MIHSAIWSKQGILYSIMYIEYNSNKNIYPEKETGSPINRSFYSLFLSNWFIFVVYLRYNYKRITNPLILQPDRSFDFGIYSLYQYTVSSTHPFLIHNKE